MEGVLELRPPGIMGKWEERYFRLDFDSLKHSVDRQSFVDSFPLDQLESINLEVPEMNFLWQGRKYRLRSNREGVIQDWHSKLQAFIGQAQGQGFAPPSRNGFQDSAPTPGSTMRSQVALSADDNSLASSWDLQSQAKKQKSRVDLMHEAHEKKLKKLQEKRDKEAMEEKKRIEEARKLTLSKTQRRASEARGKISPSEVLRTADRLFNEHNIRQQKLDEKRMAWEMQEAERINEEKFEQLPTRSASTGALQSAKEAGDRLYSDAERRELWRTQARDAQAKDELTMVRIGVKGTSASSMNRCNDLHKEAATRKDKLVKAKEKKDQEELAEITKDAVPCGAWSADTMTRLKRLFEEHEERKKKIAKEHADKVRDEQNKIDAVMKERQEKTKAKTSSRRQVPPWLDEKFPGNLPQKPKNLQPGPGEYVLAPSFPLWAPEDSGQVGSQHVANRAPAWKYAPDAKYIPPSSTAKPKKVTSHSDYALVAIQAAVDLRSGYNKQKLAPGEYARLVAKLKKVHACYSRALHQLLGQKPFGTTPAQQDPGFASLSNRPSQRLFQEHLLPENEGWIHRLEPDPIRQVEDNLEALLSSAAKAQDVLKDDIAPDVPWPSGARIQQPKGVPTALLAYDPGVKSQGSAEMKALVRFGPGEFEQRFRHLTDLSRVQLVFQTCDMLQYGLEHILKNFEVVDVRNYFANPGRLGCRYVEVLVVVIVKDGKEQVPHICEIRLEPVHYHTANKKASKLLEGFTDKDGRYQTGFYDDLKKAYSDMDPNVVECIARQVLSKPPDGKRLRSLRCHLGKRFGSMVNSWRNAFGGQRLLNFQKFREALYSMSRGTHVTEIWQELDPNHGGCISLWELDPEAMALLLKLRSRIMAVVSGAKQSGGETSDGEDVDPSVIFARLTEFVRPLTVGRLEQHEFRIVAMSKPLNMTQWEADKAFSCLDHIGGMHAPPTTIDVSDLTWLKKLPTLVDTKAICCARDITIPLASPTSAITGSPLPDENSPLSGTMKPLSATPDGEKANPKISVSPPADGKGPSSAPSAPAKPAGGKEVINRPSTPPGRDEPSDVDVDDEEEEEEPEEDDYDYDDEDEEEEDEEEDAEQEETW